ncbi:hypothetical protein SO802_022627 [Lithocarpus litseifolius]|uniref:Uncharacterized protein n=1 Tax=Lithocarpus litseifolius TaxID=425828 RepID=A0AAW2C718_9ROSI
MPVFDEELKGGVFEMVQNPVKEEELVCESKSNVNEEMKAEPVVEKTNEDLFQLDYYCCFKLLCRRTVLGLLGVCHSFHECGDDVL